MDNPVHKERSIEELEAFLQAMPDLLFIQDKNGVYIDYHASNPSLLFVQPEQFLGKSMNDILPAHIASSFSDAFLRLFATHEVQTVDYSLIVPQGELFFEARISLYGEDNVMTIVRDTTHEKKIENDLRKSEDMYRSLIENMSDILTVLDSSGTIVYISPSVERASGFTPVELIGKRVLDSVHPDDHAYVVSTLSSAFAHPETPYNLDIRLKNKDGSWRYEHLTGKVSHTSKNTLEAIVVSHDVTEEKKNELELHKFTRVIEQSSATIVITDRNGAIEYVNPAFELITGYTKEEAIGKNPKILKSGHTTKETYEQLWHTILDGKTWKGEFLNKSKAGTLYWEDVTISPIFDEKGVIINFLAVKDDITAHKRVEEEKRTNDDILKRLVSNLPGFIYRCQNDTDWTVTYMSDGVAPILGYVPLDFIEKKTSYGSLIVESDRKTVWESIQKAIQNHEAYELRYRVNAKNGDIHWMWERGRGVYDDAQVLQYLEGFITDITDQKKAEESLQHRTEELESMNKLMVGRELKMRELKHEIEKLSLGKKEDSI